jgi:hypothetical protein
MDDSSAVTSNHCFDDLAEKVASELLFEHPLFGDEVKEVFARRWFFHDVDEGVDAFIKVYQSDDSGDNLHLR